MKNKRNGKKSRKDFSRLHETLEQHYEGYRYKKDLANHDSKRHSLFNKKLRTFLVDCNKKQFIPSKAYVEKEILTIRSEIDYEISMSGIDLDSFDQNRIDINLENMDFHTVLGPKPGDNSKLYIKIFYRVFGLVPLARLTDKDIEFLKSSFGELGKHHEEDNVFLIDLMNVQISKEIDEDKKNKISDMLQRKARQRFKKYAALSGFETKFKYKLIDKIKDFFLDGNI